jgi:hypothetical protein
MEEKEKENLEFRIQALENSNKELAAEMKENKEIIKDLKFQILFRDLQKEQMEIINNVLDKDIYVVIFRASIRPCDSDGVYHVSEMNLKEPEFKGFVMDKLPEWIDNLWIAKLKSEEFEPFNGITHNPCHYSIGLTDVYYIERSHRTDEGKFRVGYREHDNWGIFGIDCHRIIPFDKEHFKDKEILDYLGKIKSLNIG